MGKILNKRIFRELKNNLLRYLILFALVAVSIYMVISMVSAAETVVNGSAEANERNAVEDGEFTTFIPLTQKQLSVLREKGTIIEEGFSTDVVMEDGSVLRAFKMREEINKVQLDEGKNAENDNELVIEKRYAQEHSLGVNDTIRVSENEYTICGIGTVPDYDQPYESLSDMSADSEHFGLIFLTDAAYEALNSKGSEMTQEYTYFYRLGNETSEDLKSRIKEFEFDYKESDDVYLKEYIDRRLEKRNDLESGINDLVDGSSGIKEALDELSKNGESISGGADAIFESYLNNTQNILQSNGYTGQLSEDNYAQVLDQLAPLYPGGELTSLKSNLDAIKEYTSGTHEYTEALNRIADSYSGVDDGAKELKNESEGFLNENFSADIDNLRSFTKSADNPRIGAGADDIAMNKSIGLFAGVVVLLLLAYVISVFVGHQVQRESGVIGSLYALGVTKKDMIMHYLKLPAFVTLAAGIAGTIIGFSKLGMDVQMESTYDYFSMPVFDKTYPLYLIIYGVVMPPILALIVNFIVLNKKLSHTALSLMRNEQKQNEESSLDLSRMKFINKFRIRQMTRESKTALTVVAGMFIAMIILMLSVDCFVYCRHVETNNVKDTNYEYMYNLKYPMAEVPDGAEECYAEALSKTDQGFTLGVTLMGIKDDSRFFEARPREGVSNAVVGTGFSTKYNVKEGDTFTLTDSVNDKEYAFRVQDVADHSVGLTVFTDIDSLRELFGQPEDYYNVLLSDSSLDIEKGRLYSVQTKEDVARSSKVFMDKMTGFITVMTVLSIVIFGTVMFLMFNVMVDRASYGISLMKIFGFRDREVRKMYMYGNLYIVIAAAIICVPLAKLLVDIAYPAMVANVTSGTFLDMPLFWYAGIVAAVIGICLFVIGVLNGKLHRITPAEVLKARD